MGFFYNSKTK